MLVREGSFDKRTLEKIFNRSYDNIQEMIAENALPQEQGFVAGVAMEKALDKFMRRALEWRFKN